MISSSLPRILVRGAGDLATGVLQSLWRAGFPLMASEVENPLAVRRTVSLCEAVYEGTAKVEDMTARRLPSLPREAEVSPDAFLWDEIDRCWKKGEIPILVDPGLQCLPAYRPQILVDATIRKKNEDLSMDLAPLVIALGPGFSAGKDCHLVIETMRGHRLGRLIFEGEALPNTHVPGIIAGKGRERVLHAPVDGILRNRHRIGDQVQACEIISEIVVKDGREVPVLAAISGLLRGLLRDGTPVTQGLKLGDIDPRRDEIENLTTISDKARNLGGAVLTGIFALRDHWEGGPSSL